MMKTIVVFSLLFALSQISNAQDVTTETLTVNVLDSYTEDPVENADVELFKDEQLVISGVTDATGIVQFIVEISATGVEEIPSHDATLLPPYPNPFIGKTSIPFSIENHSQITVSVHDILGRQVSFLQEDLHLGTHEVQVDLSGQTPGIYMLRLLDDDVVLGTSALVYSGSGGNWAPVSISIRSQESVPLSTSFLATKTSKTLSNDYEVEVSKDGYLTATQALTMPGDKDFFVRLPVGVTNTIGMELIHIPAGTFDMGAITGTGSSDQFPVHTVTLTRDFYIGKYEVTQGEYVSVVGSNPSYFTGDDLLPVESLTWYDMVRYANAISTSEGYAPCYDNDGNVIYGLGNPYACEGYRLPMEAEWEYAARAGTTTNYSFGNDDNELDNYGWYQNNSESRTHPVGEKLPNPWGLYDVHGNIWEWVYDRYSRAYYDNSISSDPRGPWTGSNRVSRGGSWYNDNPHDMRSSTRGYDKPASGYANFGFRLARTVQ